MMAYFDDDDDDGRSTASDDHSSDSAIDDGKAGAKNFHFRIEIVTFSVWPVVISSVYVSS